MESITGIDIDLGNVRKKSTLKRNAVSSLASSKGSFPSNIDEEFDLVDKQRKRAQNDSELFVSLDAALASTESPSKRSLPSQTAYNLQFPIVLARTFARLVDLLWEISIVWFVVRILLPVDTMSMLSKVLIIPCVLLPMALILDSLVQGLFKNFWAFRLSHGGDVNFHCSNPWKEIFWCGVLVFYLASFRLSLSLLFANGYSFSRVIGPVMMNTCTYVPRDLIDPFGCLYWRPRLRSHCYLYPSPTLCTVNSCSVVQDFTSGEELCANI